MNRRTSLNAFLTGWWSAFGFHQDAELARFLNKRPSVEERMYANFARAGQHLDAAMQNFAQTAKNQNPELKSSASSNRSES